MGSMQSRDGGLREATGQARRGSTRQLNRFDNTEQLTPRRLVRLLLEIEPAAKTSFARISMNRPYTLARTWLNFVMKACFSQSTTISDNMTNKTGCALVPTVPH